MKKTVLFLAVIATAIAANPWLSFHRSPPVALVINPFAFPPAASETAWVTSYTPGTPRSDFTGKVGCKFTVGGSGITLTQLGRQKIAGNSLTHVLRIKTGDDTTELGTATVDMSTGSAGDFVYAVLVGSPVALSPSTAYIITSEELNGAFDEFHNNDGSQTVTGVATVTQSGFDNGGGFTENGAGKMYGPINFKYTSP